MLRRVAAILNDQIEDIVRGWVADLRHTTETAIHNEMLSAQIVDGMKAMLVHVAATIDTGVAPDIDTARAAQAAEVASRRLTQTPRDPVAPGADRPGLPEPLLLAAPGAAETAESLGGQQPAPMHRVLFRAPDIAAPGLAADDPGLSGAPLRQALTLAMHKGRLRQSQGYQINEVVQEYFVLRRRLWTTLSAQMRRSDQPAVQLAIYVDGILDDLLAATVQAFQEAAVQDLERRAVRDPLTGLYNHDDCWERINEEVRRAHRHDVRLTLIMFDLDHLKRINDTYGHQGGNRVLLHIADCMREVARESDVLCRYAGDEFIIILPESDREQGTVLAERLRSAVRRPLFLGTGLAGHLADGTPAPAEFSVTISAGIATYPADARMAETLIAQADAALYRAKGAGRNRVA